MLFKSHEFLSMCVYRLIFIAVVIVVVIVVVVLDDETVQNERMNKIQPQKVRQSQRYLSIYGKRQSRVSWKFSSKIEKYKKIIIIVWSHVDTFLWPWMCVWVLSLCVGVISVWFGIEQMTAAGADDDDGEWSGKRKATRGTCS